MRFIVNRGSIIFIMCAIVSLVPIALATAVVVYANTFHQPSAAGGLSTFGAALLYTTPAIIFIMGDYIFYRKVVRDQDLPQHERTQAVVAFFMAFITLYVIYFISIDMVSGFLYMLTRIS